MEGFPILSVVAYARGAIGALAIACLFVIRGTEEPARSQCALAATLWVKLFTFFESFYICG